MIVIGVYDLIKCRELEFLRKRIIFCSENVRGRYTLIIFLVYGNRQLKKKTETMIVGRITIQQQKPQ